MRLDEVIQHGIDDTSIHVAIVHARTKCHRAYVYKLLDITYIIASFYQTLLFNSKDQSLS